VKVLKKLGEGAFGVVHECRIRATGQTVAVKMIDLLEADRVEIENELRILCALDHPNVVKCHDIFREECFICILMDKYVGGDLVDGLQHHLGTKGRIPELPLKGIVRQMLRAIAYLHENCIIHRDVKGDNFLMTVVDIADPNCRVALSDFGTAMRLEKNKYLKELVGTRVFWSPEVCNRNWVLLWSGIFTIWGL
jgi:serine/threonine protein kinase